MSNTANKNQKLRISARALVDFCLTEGDLISSQRPGPSAFEGQQTHASIQKMRGKDYQSEVSLAVHWVSDNFELHISGRADGVFPNGVEEIKSTRVPPAELPDSQKRNHFYQAKLYAALLCLIHDWEEIVIRMTYVHPQTLKEWSEDTLATRIKLTDYLSNLCSRYDAWLLKVLRHWHQREQYLIDLQFPFAQMRPAQRAMAETVFKACCTNRNATIEAPTGIGKSLASIFPALKAFPKVENRSLYFLTMKTTGKKAAQDALAQLDPENHLIVVFLSAKSRACLQPDSICDGEYCPFAKSYFKKRTELREALFDAKHWTPDLLQQFGEENEICPYYLSQDWAIWSDVVVGDLNYIYDTTAVQPYLLKEINNQATLLIDEGHNLIDRGRMMFSSDFSGEPLQLLLRETPKPIQKTLRKIQSQLREYCKDQQSQLVSEPPTQLVYGLRDFIASSPALLRENPGYSPGALWQEFVFICARFVRLDELANTDDFIWRYTDGSPEKRRIELICLNPASLLASKHKLVNNVITFSATFKPWQYSNQLNGLSEAVVQNLPSPFSKKQFDVYIANDVSTRYQNRQKLPDQLSRTLSQVVNSDKNSMVFFSSYAQLRSCASAIHQNERLIIQSTDWNKDKRDEVLNAFHTKTNLTLFTVLGGAFAEGIDLPGRLLEQVVIVGPGLPQINDINNAMRTRMEASSLPGFDFVYTFPGLQKVLQAAGRCIRNETDTGQILLVDDRFTQYLQKGWLPDVWSIRSGNLCDWKSD